MATQCATSSAILAVQSHQNPQIHVRLSHLSRPVCRSQPSCGSSLRSLSNLSRNNRIRKRGLQSQRRVRAAVVFEAFRRRLLVRQSQQVSTAMMDLNSKFLEGMEGKLKNLQLFEAEKKGIRIGKKQACSSQVSKLQAVGKLLSERLARAEHVGRSLGAVWSPFFGVECKDLGRNRFLFIFQQKADKDKALDAGPWRFSNDLLVMEDFLPSRTIDDYEFKSIPIWVRAYGIPMGMMSRETGILVREQIGEVVDVDPDISGDSMGVFMRIKVKIDITVPIMRFITSFIDDEEEQEHENEMKLGGDGEEKEIGGKKEEEEEKIVSFT